VRESVICTLIWNKLEIGGRILMSSCCLHEMFHIADVFASVESSMINLLHLFILMNVTISKHCLYCNMCHYNYQLGNGHKYDTKHKWRFMQRCTRY
jgi:hypothetical protein